MVWFLGGCEGSIEDKYNLFNFAVQIGLWNDNHGIACQCYMLSFLGFQWLHRKGSQNYALRHPQSLHLLTRMLNSETPSLRYA